MADDNMLVPFHGKPVIEYDETPPTKLLRRRQQQSVAPNTAMSQASPPRGSGQFSIQFQFLSPAMTQAQKNSFIYAANRLGKMITTKHSPVQVPQSMRCTALPNQVLPSTIQDLFIFVQISPIDGVSDTLGQAGPCILDNNGFPRVGYVQFDVADVDDMISKRTFDAVCLHEISHILGFGTLWSDRSLVQNAGQPDPRYNGKGGIRGMNIIAPNNTWQTPLVQNTGGSGTAGSHWRDSAFGYEMMTAYLDQAYQPYSAMSVESFTDLGYTVDSSTFDVFTVDQKSGAGVPPNGKPSSETTTTWTRFGGGGLDSTDIWIMACLIAVFAVFVLSCVYSRCRRRKQQAPPPPRPVQPQQQMQQQQNYGFDADNVPVAMAVPVVEEAKISSFQDVTQCYDVSVAYEYISRADGNVQLAINHYMQDSAHRGVAIV